MVLDSGELIFVFWTTFLSSNYFGARLEVQCWFEHGASAECSGWPWAGTTQLDVEGRDSTQEDPIFLGHPAESAQIPRVLGLMFCRCRSDAKLMLTFLMFLMFSRRFSMFSMSVEFHTLERVDADPQICWRFGWLDVHGCEFAACLLSVEWGDAHFQSYTQRWHCREILGSGRFLELILFQGRKTA